jgi:hypothetical protein
MTPEVINRLAVSVQPLIFETGIDTTPYSAKGTVFFVGYRGHAFAITARHALHPDDLGPICLFPTDTSHRLMTLKDVFFVPREQVDDDFVDLAIVEIDMADARNPELGQATLIDLALASRSWASRADEGAFVLIGYPEEHSFVDYDRELLVNDRFALHARYVEPSTSPHIHILEVLDTRSLTTFSGFSGGPVFGWFQTDSERAEVVLCGMALRGTPTSRRLHFLDREMLINALNVKLGLTRISARQ